MATYWVTATGAGTNAGTQANPYHTIDTAYAQLQAAGVKGDIVNVIADGNHVMPSAGVTILTNASLGGTSFSDPGFTIRGTDANGNPSLATVVAGTSARFLSLRGGVRYIIARGLKLDFTASTGGTNASLVRDATAGPILFEASYLKGNADNSISALSRAIMEGTTTGPSDYGIIRYCYLENMLDPIVASLGSTTKKLSVHHNVVSFTGDWSNTFVGTMQLGTTPVNSGNVIEFYQNTIYINDNGGSTIASMFDWGPASGNTGTINLHSNYGWIETTGLVTQVFAGAAGSTATYVGTIGYNSIYFGPSVVVGDNSGLLYEAPYDGGVDPKATDFTQYTTAAASVFNAPTTAWDWADINSLGYTIPLPRDLRPLNRLTSSSTGGVPGALPAPQTDYSVTISANSTAPEVDQSVTFTITHTNTGVNATGVTAIVTLPSGLTFVSATPSQGSYASGTWTIGSQATGTTVTLTLVATVDSDQGGSSLTVTVAHGAGDPSTDTDSSDNSDSILLQVVDDTSTIDPEQPGGAPYIDLLPLIRPDLRAEMNVAVTLKRNRVIEALQRFDDENRYWSEHSFRSVVLATNSTTQVRLSGVARGEFLVLQCVTAVDVSAVKGDTARFWPSIRHLSIGRGDFERIDLRNRSTTVTATVYLGVID